MFAICNILFVAHYNLFIMFNFLFIEYNYLFVFLKYLFPESEINYLVLKINFIKYCANIDLVIEKIMVQSKFNLDVRFDS